MTYFDADGKTPRVEAAVARLRDALVDLCDALFDDDDLDDVEVLVDALLRSVLRERGVE